MRPVLAALRAMLLCHPASAAGYAVQLDAARCIPLDPSTVTQLGPDWQPVARYVQRCPVAGPDGRPALSVDIVRVDHAYADGVFDAQPSLAVPTPVLHDPSGRAVGGLPEAFPADPPGALRVTFADWHGGLPRRIDLFEAGASTLPPHALPPLRWDLKANAYR